MESLHTGPLRPCCVTVPYTSIQVQFEAFFEYVVDSNQFFYGMQNIIQAMLKMFMMMMMMMTPDAPQSP